MLIERSKLVTFVSIFILSVVVLYAIAYVGLNTDIDNTEANYYNPNDSYITSLVQVSYNDTKNPPSLDVEINYRRYNNQSLVDDDICINKITFVVFTETGTRTKALTSSAPLFCITKKGAVEEHRVYSESLEIPLSNIKYYPYDNVLAAFQVKASGYYKNDNTSIESVPMDIEWSIAFNNRQIEHYVTKEGDGISDYQITVDARRPIVYRYLSPLLLASILLLLFLVYITPDIDSSMQIYLGVIFGVWSIRQILVPEEVKSAILLDVVFFSLYLYAFTFMAMRLAKHISSSKASNHHANYRDVNTHRGQQAKFTTTIASHGRRSRTRSNK
jgi:hypothetical protein